MADTITAQLEEQGLADAEHEFERRQVEVAADATFFGQMENLVRRHPGPALLAGLGLGIGLGMIVRGLACSRG
jgi:hypothetical protein